MAKAQQPRPEVTTSQVRPAPSKVELSAELEAIRARLAERRKTLGSTVTPYSATDLADAEWLMVELDKSLGGSAALTPAETAELAALTKRRALTPAQQAVMDRIAALHGKLTTDDMIEHDYLIIQQDRMLGPDLPRFQELMAKAAKLKPI